MEKKKWTNAKKAEAFVSKIIGSGTWSIDTLFERTLSDKRTKDILNPEQLRAYLRNRPNLFDLTPDDEVSCRANNPYLGTAEFVTITIGSGTWSINTLFEKLQSDPYSRMVKFRQIPSNPNKLRVFIRNRPELFYLTPDDEVSCPASDPQLTAVITITIGSGTWSINSLFEKLQSDPRIKGIASNPEQLRAFIRRRPKLFDLTHDEVSCLANNPYLRTNAFIVITIGSGAWWSIYALFEKLQSDSRIKGIASNPKQLLAYLRNRPNLFDLTPDGKVSCCTSVKHVRQTKENMINWMDHDDAENSVIRVYNGSFKLLFKNETLGLDLQNNPDFCEIPGVGFHLKALDLDQLFVYVVQRLTHDAIEWWELIEDCVSMMKAKNCEIFPGMKQLVELVIKRFHNVFICKLTTYVKLKSKPDDQISPERIVMEILRAQELTKPKSMQDLFDALPKFITVELQSPAELETFCSKMVTLQHLIQDPEEQLCVELSPTGDFESNDSVIEI